MVGFEPTTFSITLRFSVTFNYLSSTQFFHRISCQTYPEPNRYMTIYAPVTVFHSLHIFFHLPQRQSHFAKNGFDFRNALPVKGHLTELHFNRNTNPKISVLNATVLRMYLSYAQTTLGVSPTFTPTYYCSCL